MHVDIEMSAGHRVPSAHGPHMLAWSHILDEIFADAYRNGISSLRFILPLTSLEDEVHLRADLTPAGAGGNALAVLDGSAPHHGASRIYHVSFGSLVSGPRRHSSAGNRVTNRLSVYTWQARVWGIPIRIAALLGRPALVDRCMFAMRRSFVTRRPTAAYYHLSISDGADDH